MLSTIRFPNTKLEAFASSQLFYQIRLLCANIDALNNGKLKIRVQKGHIVFTVVITLVILFVGYVVFSRYLPSVETQEKTNPSEPSPKIIYLEATPSATQTTQISTSTSPKPTSKSTSTVKASPLGSPAPFQDPCKDYKQSDGLAYLNVTFQYPNTQDADTTFTIKPAGQCPAVSPTGGSGGVTQTITTGTTSWRSPGFGPGQVRVDVNYKGQGQGFDINFTSGNHNLTVDLKNP